MKARAVALAFTMFAAACGGTTETTGSTANTSGGGASNGGTGGDVGVGGAPIGLQTCVLSSDCAGALVCSSRLCHAECTATKDCPASQRCVQVGMGDASPLTKVCQLPQESQCVHDSDCAVPLVCALDQQCRNHCQTARDCLAGQVCSRTDGGLIDGVCVDPSGR